MDPPSADRGHDRLCRYPEALNFGFILRNLFPSGGFPVCPSDPHPSGGFPVRDPRSAMVSPAARALGRLATRIQ
jgi:hypothetical protein